MTADLLFTGANGQVGWELQRRAPASGMQAVGLDRGTLDITDRDSVQSAVKAVKPRAVINAGAYTAVDKAESEREIAFAVNRDGPAHLAAICAALNIPLIHISTDYVFDGTKIGPYREDDPVAPLGAYGASKLAGEDAVRARTPRHVILRTAWVYGIHGHNFVKTMLRLGAEREQLRVVDDQRGCPTFAGDLAAGLLALSRRLLEHPSNESYGTFHCTGQGQTTWCGFARRIFDVAGPRLAKRPQVNAIATADYPTPARRPANSVLDCSKLTRVHGITLRPWEQGLDEMLAATLKAA